MSSEVKKVRSEQMARKEIREATDEKEESPNKGEHPEVDKSLKKEKKDKPLIRLALRTEWDGTGYAGWQFQDNARSLQECLEKALGKLYKGPIRVHGSSRTDAGVHAWGHVCHFDAPSGIPLDRLPLALNSLLPDDIAVQEAQQVAPDFHARFQARGKQYSYYIYRAENRSAFYSRYAYREIRPLDLDKMRSACRLLEGKHDFRGFMAAGGQVKTTVRTLYLVDLEEQGPLLRIRVRGDGFLYNMVRILAGTLLYVGLGKLSLAQLEEVLRVGDRSLAGKTLPACGLFLDEVYYEPNPFLSVEDSPRVTHRVEEGFFLPKGAGRGQAEAESRQKEKEKVNEPATMESRE